MINLNVLPDCRSSFAAWTAELTLLFRENGSAFLLLADEEIVRACLRAVPFDALGRPPVRTGARKTCASMYLYVPRLLADDGGVQRREKAKRAELRNIAKTLSRFYYKYRVKSNTVAVRRPENRWGKLRPSRNCRRRGHLDA